MATPLGSPPEASISRQCHAQYNTVFSQIVINDSGTNDAETGIQAEISSLGLDLRNEATLGNANGTATLINQDDLDQSADIVQNNTVTNEISITTGKSLTASGTGIRAEIDVDDVHLANTASFEFSNDATSVADDLHKLAEVEQSNIVTSTINVANTGSVKAGTVGVSAEILNGLDIAGEYGQRGHRWRRRRRFGRHTQTARFSQTNQVESKINVNNSGSIWGANRGIVASILGANVSASEFGDIEPEASPRSPDERSLPAPSASTMPAPSRRREFVRHRDGRARAPR